MKTFIFHLEFVLLVIVCTAPRLSTQYVITDVQLVDSWQPNSGRVHVQIDNSTWLDVCDGMWDNEEGQVVCRQLGFPGLARRLRGRRIAGQRSTTSVRNFNCTGSESSLSECRYESRDMMCGSDRGAGVTCSVITDVRLVEQSQPTSGRVQVQIEDSRWLDVCDNRWGIEDGRVVCQQLGFPGLAERLGGIRIGNRSTESVWDFECKGSESTLSECRHVRRDMLCGPTDGAGVTCLHAFPTTEAPTEVTTAVLPTAERTTREGRYGTTARPTADDGVLNGAYIGLALGCVLFVVCASVTVVCLLKRHKRSANNSQRSNHLVLGELGNSQAGQAALNVGDSSAEYDYCAVEGKGIPVDAGYVNAPTEAPVKTRQAEKAAPKSVDNSAEYSYCAVEGKEIPVDAGYVNAPNQAPVKTCQAKQAAPKSVDTSAEYAYCAVEGKGILKGSVDAEAGYLLPNPAPIKTSLNI